VPRTDIDQLLAVRRIGLPEDSLGLLTPAAARRQDHEANGSVTGMGALLTPWRVIGQGGRDRPRRLRQRLEPNLLDRGPLLRRPPHLDHAAHPASARPVLHRDHLQQRRIGGRPFPLWWTDQGGG